MPLIDGFTAHPAFPVLLAVSKEDVGPGPVLRTVLLVGLIGVPLTAWFLLRGYRKKD